MECINCHSKLIKDAKFCQKCGHKVETEVISNGVLNDNKRKIMLWISGGLLGVRLFSLTMMLTPIHYLLLFFPGGIIALILAIICRVKYKDDTALALIIISLVILLVEAILLFILGWIFDFLSGCVAIG